MKVGSLNEANILPRIRQFWNAHFPLISVEPGESYDWIDHREYGLMGNHQHPLIATLVDAMGLVQYVRQGQMYETFCTVELKTATTHKTLQKAEMLASSEGQFLFIDFSKAGSVQAFHQAIPDIGHRCQVIHHAVATGVFLSLYV